MKIQTNKLTPYEFNKEFFEDVKGEDYDGLKQDIKENGIKVDLHVTKSNIILCGHQRWKIAKEIELKEIPIKVIDIDESDSKKVKEYVIKDNLLRRHLSTEQKYILIGTLSEIYENPTGQDHKSKKYQEAKIASCHENVLSKTSKVTGVSERTVITARKYTELIKKAPELKQKKITDVINNYQIKNNKVIRKNTKVEINLKTVENYDENIYYFKGVYSERRFGDNVIAIDTTHGEDDIREYKDFFPTITRLSRLFHSDGREFSLREYAKVQNFPDDYKFIGNKGDVKDQIGEAVSPVMGKFIIDKHIKGEKYIELFCGVGGFSANLDNKACWAVDFNKSAGYAYQLNNPDTEVYIGDIRDCNEKEIYDKIGEIDFILGGPPCQGFSSAGHRLGFKEDSRNQLYLEYLRFVKEFKPKQFIMENVKEIYNHKDEIIKDFKNIGYDVKVEKVNGLDIGMKQKRIRIFFIGNKI